MVQLPHAAATDKLRAQYAHAAVPAVYHEYSTCSTCSAQLLKGQVDA